MIFTTRDLDILRFLRWCRFVLAKDLTGVFSKAEVQNLEILRLIKLYQPAQAYTLTAAGNRLLDAAFPKLPAAVAPAYKAADTIRRIRQVKLKYISEKCGKVTISVLNNQMPMMPLFSPVYSSTRPYSQTRSNTQRDLMNPDEVLRLENRKCLALFKGHKPALLYKMTPEELPDYAGLTTCRVIDYIPEWRRKEVETAPQKKAPVQEEAPNIPKPPDKEKQPDRSGQPPAYDLAEDDEIGMVECTVESIRGL